MSIYAKNAHSQDMRVSIVLQNASMKDVIKEIEQKTDYLFLYNKGDVDVDRKISINIKDTKVSDLLTYLFNDTNIKHVLVGNNVVLIKKDQLHHQQDECIINGTVIDTMGEPLPGVSIVIKGTTIGQITNIDGKYSITVPGKDAVLVFSFLGYAPQEVMVGDRTVIDIILAEDTQQLEEVVVVGYGVQKKINLTGSLSTVNSDAIKNRPVSNLSSALQGTMPGVTVIQDNGQPGKNTGSIRIRGIGTLNNSNPMVVVDGIISSIDDVNPEDIENLTVLKDAASAAIYGSRAANGVILITTKQGKKNSLRINFNMNMGVQKPTRLPKYLGSADNAVLYNEALANEGRPAQFTEDDIRKFADGSDPYGHPNTDWIDLFYRGSGFQQNYYLDLTGGSDNTRYAFSMGYLEQYGNVKNTTYDRYTGRFNINSQVCKRLNVSANLSYTLGMQEEPTNPYSKEFSTYIWQVYRFSPIVPYKYENGHYGYLTDGSPLAWLESGSVSKVNRNSILGNLTLEYEIIDGLKFKPTLGYNTILIGTKAFAKDIQYYDAKGNPTLYQGPNQLDEKRETTSNLTLQALLTYDRDFGKHHVSALAGYSREYTSYQWISGMRKDFLNNELSELNAGSTEGQETKGSGYEIGLLSYFGRLSYDFDSKYFIEANIRRDGSSRFASGNQWGTYPSFSAAWRISSEDFFQGVSFINELKLRGSWGLLGNQYLPTSVGNYPTYAVYSLGQNYNFGGAIATGAAQVNGANEELKWETSENYGVGIDARFLQNRLEVNLDYYKRITSDILLDAPVSRVYGLTTPAQNIGEVSNAGIDLVMGYKGDIGKLHYNVSGNLSYVKNKITRLNTSAPIVKDTYFLWQEGYSINALYGLEAMGIFQTPDEISAHASQTPIGTPKPGDLIYKNQNPDVDNKVDGDDRVFLGNTFPTTSYGFNVALSFGSFDFSMFWQGAFGHKGLIYGDPAGMVGNAIGKATPVMLDRWTQPGNNQYPRLLITERQNSAMWNPSSFWVKSKAYLRLKNIQVGYNFPSSLLSKINIKGLRIYYTGQNLFTFTGFMTGFDPEMPVGRGSTYPQVSINSVGINLTF